MARIFIVEGEDHGADALGATLRAAGHEIAGTAISTFEAHDRVARTRPDLAVVDVRSRSGGDHVELAAALSRRFGLPTVFVSAVSDTGTLRRVGRAGDSSLLLQPFDDRQLRAAVELALLRRAHEQARRGEAERTAVSDKLKLLATLASGLARTLEPQLSPADHRALGAELEGLARVRAARALPLRRLAGRAVEAMRERLGHRAVFELDGDPELHVAGDEAQLVRALDLLATIALHAHGGGAGTWVRVNVARSEAGLAQAELVVTTGREAAAGTPVPLPALPLGAAVAVAGGIAAAHGGAVTCEREAGRTVATLSLPAASAEDGQAARLVTAG